MWTYSKLKDSPSVKLQFEAVKQNKQTGLHTPKSVIPRNEVEISMKAMLPAKLFNILLQKNKVYVRLVRFEYTML